MHLLNIKMIDHLMCHDHHYGCHCYSQVSYDSYCQCSYISCDASYYYYYACYSCSSCCCSSCSSLIFFFFFFFVFFFFFPSRLLLFVSLLYLYVLYDYHTSWWYWSACYDLGASRIPPGRVVRLRCCCCRTIGNHSNSCDYITTVVSREKPHIISSSIIWFYKQHRF